MKTIPEDLLFRAQFSEIHEPVINIEMVDYKYKNEVVPYIVEHLNLES